MYTIALKVKNIDTETAEAISAFIMRGLKAEGLGANVVGIDIEIDTNEDHNLI